MRRMTRAQRAEQWNNDYDTLVRALPPGLYTGEDVRNSVERFIGEPHHPNCWGAAFRRALSNVRAFRPLLRTRPMRSPTSHGRRTRLYRKVR